MLRAKALAALVNEEVASASVGGGNRSGSDACQVRGCCSGQCVCCMWSVLGLIHGALRCCHQHFQAPSGPPTYKPLAAPLRR